MKKILLTLLLLVLLPGCASLAQKTSPAIYPTEQLPTVIALTVAAGGQTQSPAPQTSLPASATTGPAANATASAALTPARTAAETAAVPAKATDNTGPTLQPSFTPSLTPADSTSTLTPTATWARPTRTPTATPGIPDSSIQILSPGPASKVTSPIRVRAYMKPGDRGNVRLELLGEDGRLLVRKILNYAEGVRTQVVEDMDFEISGVAEASRLQISTEDDHGRITALASVNLLLLSVGEDDINPPGDLQEEIVVREPAENTLIQGGLLIVSGLARPVYKSPLVIDLIGDDGTPIGPNKLVDVPQSADGSFTAFTVEVPYSVEKPIWVLLRITERGDRIPGDTHITTLPILISP